jgi:hypothetical protein
MVSTCFGASFTHGVFLGKNTKFIIFYGILKFLLLIVFGRLRPTVVVLGNSGLILLHW